MTDWPHYFGPTTAQCIVGVLVGRSPFTYKVTFQIQIRALLERLLCTLEELYSHILLHCEACVC
jgi:hypothetical protein